MLTFISGERTIAEQWQEDLDIKHQHQMGVREKKKEHYEEAMEKADTGQPSTEFVSFWSFLPVTFILEDKKHLFRYFGPFLHTQKSRQLPLIFDTVSPTGFKSWKLQNTRAILGLFPLTYIIKFNPCTLFTRNFPRCPEIL